MRYIVLRLSIGRCDRLRGQDYQNKNSRGRRWSAPYPVRSLLLVALESIIVVKKICRLCLHNNKNRGEEERAGERHLLWAWFAAAASTYTFALASCCYFIDGRKRSFAAPGSTSETTLLGDSQHAHVRTYIHHTTPEHIGVTCTRAVLCLHRGACFGVFTDLSLPPCCLASLAQLCS